MQLANLELGSLGWIHTELRWYFTEGRAAQSGLRSSQGSFETRLASGCDAMPWRPVLFDDRLVKHLSRARAIERSMAVMPSKLAIRLVKANDPELMHGVEILGPGCGLVEDTTFVRERNTQQAVSALRAACRRVERGKASRQDKRIVSIARRNCSDLYQEALRAYGRAEKWRTSAADNGLFPGRHEEVRGHRRAAG